MENEDRIKLFGMSHALLERDLDKVEDSYKLDLQRKQEETHDEYYYAQFDFTLRKEAISMARHYELFYCLEKSTRKLVCETLEGIHGDNWFDKCAPDIVKKNAKENMQREIDSGITTRSDNEIDYTTFGELGEIVRNNWTDFDPIFSSQKAFTKIMTSLNILRGPIAHCCLLAEDEIVRLQLTMKDWFRLME
jgi:hypothetical protein